MDTNNAARARPATRLSASFFTVESANEALVLVRKVVKDITGDYQELMRLRTDRHELALLADAHEQLEYLGARIEQQVDRLKQLGQELADIGCELKDLPGGLVDFPARLEGRRILLCWKLGEPEVAFWHELRAGFAGRQPIDAEFRRRLHDTAPVAAETIGPA